MTVWDAFTSAAERFADRTAVEIQRDAATECWSYQQLHDRALARAGWLVGAGVTSGDRCAILADNDGNWCAAYLGILRIGGIVIPLDTSYSPAQVATIVGDTLPLVILVGERLSGVARDALAAFPGTRIADLNDMPPFETARPLKQINGNADDAAVILYTSGATADPKGVVLSHGNLIAARDAASEALRVSEQDRVLCVLPLSHSLAQLTNLLLPLMAGARVVFLDTARSPELIRTLSERRITIFVCAPQFFHLIHEHVMQEVARGGRRGRGFEWLLSLNLFSRRAGVNLGPSIFARAHALMGRQMRFFVTGGAKLDPAVGRDLYGMGFTVLQIYGLAETSGAATLTGPDDALLDTVGRVLPGQELKIVPYDDDANRDGEIAVRGPIVMQGYFKRSEATNDVVRDGWLLTGDLGRLASDGRLTITGRKHDVIVLASGEIVSPDEIEANYRQSQFVREICVLGFAGKDEPAAEHLFAVIVPDMRVMRQRKIANTGDLLRFEMEGLSVHLPAHKRVPVYAIWFEPLPRTTTGGLKRHEIKQRLRQKQHDAVRTRTNDLASDRQWPDDHAVAVAAIVARRARHVVAPESNLELDLGLDSIERVELFAEIEQCLGVRISEGEAHEILTVAELIEAVRVDVLTVVTAPVDDSWARILGTLPPAHDSLLRSLLRRRPIGAPLLYILLRVVRLLVPRTRFVGIEHVPAHGPYIICPNHQGYLDPFLVCSGLPYHVFRQVFFVGAAEYFETPAMAWLAREANLVPVDPDANLVPAMRAGGFGLAHGKVLLLFPEGERSIDGTVKHFKKGAAILSRHMKVPIVPVAIRGAYEMWPRNRSVNWKVLIPWSGHRIRIDFGAPMQFDDSVSHADAAARLRSHVEQMWQKQEKS